MEQEIIILGAGESGNGAALLAKYLGYKVFVSDKNRIKTIHKNELIASGIEFEENGHNEERILNGSSIIKSPGIPPSIDLIKKAKQQGIEVISEIEFAYRHKGNSKIIGITGSNGKSTTTTLIYYLLDQAGYEVALVGNIGVSIARQMAEKVKEWYVVELSSFQLEDIKFFRPDIALILNITPDHLDRYNNNFREYAETKFKITENQTSNDVLIVNKDDQTIVQIINQLSIKSNIIYFTMNPNNIENNQDGAFIDEQNIMNIQYNKEVFQASIQDLGLKGKHNQYNTMAAGISARAAGLRSDALKNSFAAFNGLEHRLEFVATVKGIDFINDSKATNLNSVWFALESMTKPVVLILGGQDKGNDYNEILELVQEKVKAIVCLGADNLPIIQAFGNVVPNIIETKSAKDAVLASYSIADSGDVVLLAPGCASFDLFENFEDRGVQFKNAVLEL